MINRKLICLVVTLFISLASLKSQDDFYYSDTDAVEMFKEAKEIYNKGSYEKAIVMLTELLQAYPDFELAYNQMGYCYFNLKDYKKAIEILDKGCEYRSFDAKFFYLKAQCYDKLKEYELALKYLNLTISISPENSFYYGYRANLLMELRQYERALKDYNMALSLKPDEVGYLYNRGILKHNLKNYKSACGDWFLGKSNSDACQQFYFYKCTQYKIEELVLEKPSRIIIELPLFDTLEYLSFRQFYSVKLNYPDSAYLNNINGTVVAKFTIKSNGNVSDIVILKSVHKVLDNEVIRFIDQTSGNWIACRKNDVAKDITCILPVSFKSTDSYSDKLDYLKIMRSDSVSILTRQNAFKEYLKFYPFQAEIYSEYSKFLKSHNLSDESFNPDWHSNLSNQDCFLMKEVKCEGNYLKIYYNNFWEITTKENSMYYRITEWNDSYRFFSGKFNDFTKNGELIAEGEYENAIKKGKFLFYYNNGQLEKEINFKTGSPYGECKFYYPSGVLMQKLLIWGKEFEVKEYNNPDGSSKLLLGTGNWEYSFYDYTNTKIIKVSGSLINNKKEGVWKCYYDNILLVEETWKNGEFEKGFIYEGNSRSKISNSEIGSWVFIPHSIVRTENILREKDLPDWYMENIRH